MTRKLTLLSACLVSAIVLSPSFVLGSVRAQETTTETEATASDAQTTTLPGRLEKRKAEQQLRLSNAQKNRIKARCRAAQAKLGTINQRALEVKTKRLRAYANIDDSLTKLIEKIGDRADTNKLQTEVQVLTEKVSVLEKAMTDYGQAIADLIAIDCEADPDGFKASLEDARSQKEVLKASSLDVRSYLHETIKPTLKTIREELAKNKAETN